MAVSIDNVYQRVLTIANKEQRGYITPQEFNLLAYKAQMDIFESYFYNYESKLARPNLSNDTAIDTDILYEKILPFKKSTLVAPITNTAVTSISGVKYGVTDVVVGGFNIPSDVFYLEGLWNGTGSPAQEVSSSDFFKMISLNKFRPTPLNPIFCRGPIPKSLFRKSSTFTKDLTGRSPHIKEIVGDHKTSDYILSQNPDLVKVLLAPMEASDYKDPINPGRKATFKYIVKPEKPNWAYVVVNSKPLYNPTLSINFDLHESEESTLTNKILELAGIVINKPDLSEVVLRNEAMKDAIKNQ
tara:strand:+ start:173 stop:1072 length:900 start_codon:yes stop_codon:yes gene_type:complete